MIEMIRFHALNDLRRYTSRNAGPFIRRTGVRPFSTPQTTVALVATECSGTPSLWHGTVANNTILDQPPSATGQGRPWHSPPLPRPAQCNAEKKSLLQEETGNDMEIARIVVCRDRSSPPCRRRATARATPTQRLRADAGGWIRDDLAAPSLAKDGRVRRRHSLCGPVEAAQAGHPVRGDAAERRLRTGATVQPRLPARNVQRLLRPLRHGDGQAAALRCGMPQGAPTLDEQAGSQAGPAVETGPGVEAAQVCYSRARPLPWAVRLHLRRAERRAVRDASLQIRAPDPTLGQDGGARRDLPHHVRSWPLNPGPRPSPSLALATVLTPLTYYYYYYFTLLRTTWLLVTCYSQELARLPLPRPHRRLHLRHRLPDEGPHTP